MSVCLSSCISIKEKERVNAIPYNINVEKELEMIYNDLLNAGVDTIVIFYKGCSGCISNINKMGYVIWNDSNSFYVKKVDSNNKYYDPVKTIDSFSYFFTNEKQIREEKLVFPEMEFLHYHYSKLMLKYPKGVFTKEVSESQRLLKENENKKIVIWISKIESALFNIERSDLIWNR